MCDIDAVDSAEPRTNSKSNVSNKCSVFDRLAMDDDMLIQSYSFLVENSGLSGEPLTIIRGLSSTLDDLVVKDSEATDQP